MSDSVLPGVENKASSAPVAAAVVPDRPKLDPVAVFAALGSEVRLPIMKLLADGRELSPTAIAAELGREFDGVGKQLFVLRNAGLVSATVGQDRRQTMYRIPASLRPAPGVLDVGFGRIELDRL